jgi:hypothetical protein
MVDVFLPISETKIYLKSMSCRVVGLLDTRVKPAEKLGRFELFATFDVDL